MYIKEDLCRRDREKGAKTAMIYLQSALQRAGFPLAFILLFILTHPYHLDCCARRLLSLQPDFMAQKSAIEEIVEAESHMVLFSRGSIVNSIISNISGPIPNDMLGKIAITRLRAYEKLFQLP
jgi:hypothetical protein